MLTRRRRARIERETAERVTELRLVRTGLRLRAEIDRMRAAGERQWAAWLTYAPNILTTAFVRGLTR